MKFLLQEKKILILIPDLSGIGGVASYYRVLKLDQEKNIDHFVVNKWDNRLGYLGKFIHLMIKYIKLLSIAKDYDHFHLNVSMDFKSYYRDMGFIAIILLCKKPFSVFFHGWDFNFEEKIKSSSFQRILFRLTYAKMKGCFFLGRIFKKRLRELKVNPDCIWIFETTAADDSYLSTADLSEKFAQKETLKILFLSRVVIEKGIIEALDAFRWAAEKATGKKLEFILAGDGADLQLARSYVRSNGIANVRLTGDVRDQLKHEILRDADIFIFPTYFPEGQPSVNLEAMLYGMPIISRINAGIPDVVVHGENGFLTESKDAKVFEQFLTKLVFDDALRIAMGKRNHYYAKANFTKEPIRNRVLQHFERMLKNSN